MDFLEFVGDDASAKVLSSLDDPADLARACSVSRSWYQFVIRNGIFKRLCQRMAPEVSVFASVTEESSSDRNAERGSSNDTEWEMLEREHRAYSYLCHCLVSPKRKENCILEPIGASSTDYYRDEGIENTMDPSDRAVLGTSYWSSKGTDDPTVSENLTYRLNSNLCIVSEVKIHPFKAYFQFGHPIYPSKAVQFRIGYSNIGHTTTDEVLTGQQCTDDEYIWTYVSPEYPMDQVNALQSFKLPRPVICIGGIVRIELLGRVQKQDLARLYYICIRHIKVIGRNLSPVFDYDHDPASSPVLKYFPDARPPDTPETRESEARTQSVMQAIATRIRGFSWNHLPLNRFFVAMQDDN